MNVLFYWITAHFALMVHKFHDLRHKLNGHGTQLRSWYTYFMSHGTNLTVVAHICNWPTVEFKTVLLTESSHTVWCGVMQCGAVCCSVLQCVAVWCSALQCVAVYCSVLQCIAMRCNTLQYVAVWRIVCWIMAHICAYFIDNGIRSSLDMKCISWVMAHTFLESWHTYFMDHDTHIWVLTCDRIWNCCTRCGLDYGTPT